MPFDLQSLKHELNPEQYRAVTTTEGPILIIAGAGSGKTRVITYRIAHMLNIGIPQSQILALTFTNKAAKEMETRIKELTGKKLQNLTVSTFHAFGVRILRKHIEKLGWRENFSIYDETDRSSLIKETGRELHFTQDSLDVYKIGGLFSNIKTGRKNWESANDMYKSLYESYQEGLKLFNAVDFDDLIVLPIKLFRSHPEVLEEYKNTYKYIMVDEFQDTSHQQYEMMRLLADKNVAVVGDDDQSIYSWRGADYRNIIQFEKDFPNVTEIRLEQNYRSTTTILAAANGVISHNTNRKDKKLWSEKRGGKPIEIFMPENETAEADFIAEMIQGVAAEERIKYDNFGVLIRANTQSRPIEEAFLEANIPYTMSGGTSFFQRKEIKDIISYLRVIANRNDDVNLLRIINVPRRGIGRTTIETLNNCAKAMECSIWTAMETILKTENAPVSENVKNDLRSFVSIIENNSSMISGKNLAKKARALVDQINYRDHLITEYSKNEKAARFKLLNIESFIDSMEIWENDADNYDGNLYTYLNRITLLSRDDLEDEDQGKVNLMTIHASKGLEFPVVFIAGAEEGLIPHARSVEENGGSVEEERRLFYVAITRARNKLFISACRKRRRQQSIVECEPSCFLDEIPQNLIEYHQPPKAPDDKTALEFLKQMKRNLNA
ncbi:UvrD-helicase domain-containing protein [Treponema parvum]|uniref:DNA 3'-5' helicase n=1 Tax=Treponema parvum TaxID=138851 RepID=A0A975ICV6_9SPIR|nr:UvrD-helicase domain-containing protein [Treponema parvum]QTQ12103.1 UvrD-helicase domain-containing protein [Treponema parvum]